MFNKTIAIVIGLLVIAGGVYYAYTAGVFGGAEELSIPNPASIYCEQALGGTIELVSSSDGGQVGLCHLPDGSVCNEWVLYNNQSSSCVLEEGIEAVSPGKDPIADAVRTYAATQAGAEETEVVVSTPMLTEWTDSCLGLGGSAESCLQAITPGYEVMASINGTQKIFRTNADGSVIREDTLPPDPEESEE